MMIQGQEDPMQISTIGIDIGKNSFHFVGFDAQRSVKPTVRDSASAHSKASGPTRTGGGWRSPNS
jgi:hypothetical protein